MSITRVIPVSLSTEVSESTSADLVISTVTYPDSANGASNTGGDTVTLTGSNFDANIAIYVNSNLVSNINVSNSSYLTFSSPTLDIDKYIIYAVNPDGTTGVFAEGLNVIEGITYTFQGTVSGYTSGSYLSNIIDKFSFSSDGNATDVGDLSTTRYGSAGQSSSTNGYTSGGVSPVSTFNIIDKFSFSSDANATDVGDITQVRYQVSGQSSTDNGYTSGGGSLYGAIVNTIDKFPFSSDANATDVGNLTETRRYTAGQSSATSGYTSGAFSASNVIDKFPFASDANATDVGDLSVGRRAQAGQSSTNSGYNSGGAPPPGGVDIIDKFPFASDGNATDVGNLTTAGRYDPTGQQV